mgnify:CR=1 FL=1
MTVGGGNIFRGLAIAAKGGDRVILMAGIPFGTAGSTNVLHVVRLIGEPHVVVHLDDRADQADVGVPVAVLQHRDADSRVPAQVRQPPVEIAGFGPHQRFLHEVVGTDRADGNAVLLADTPVMDRLMATYPTTSLRTSGEDVGLPAALFCLISAPIVIYPLVRLGQSTTPEVTPVQPAISDDRITH